MLGADVGTASIDGVVVFGLAEVVVLAGVVGVSLVVEACDVVEL